MNFLSRKINYNYDDKGNRILKKSASSSEFYIRDLSGREIAVFDNVNDRMKLFNLFGAGAIGKVEPNYVQKTGTTPDGETYTYFERTDKRYYYIKDHLGTIRVTLNEDNTLSSAQDYFPFGGILSGRSIVQGSATNKYKFTEKERDTESNLDYFGMRYYDNEIGRWLSPDRLADKHVGWSSYNYCMNNPLISIDPNGDSAIVLLAPDVVPFPGNPGHVAILIGNNDDGWDFYSKDGTEENFGIVGKPKVKAEHFNSISEFNLYNEKIGNIYKKGFLIQTSFKQDEEMRKTSITEIYSTYVLTGRSCNTHLQKALTSAGKQWLVPTASTLDQAAQILIPKIFYESVKIMNKHGNYEIDLKTGKRIE